MSTFLSQMMRCIPITLMTRSDKEHMEKYTSDSFRDLTRIARINDQMWRELFVANKNVLLNRMDMFLKEFSKIRTMIEQKEIDGLNVFFVL